MLNEPELFKRFCTVLPGGSSAEKETNQYGIYFSLLTEDCLEDMHRYSIDERLYEYLESRPFKTKSETQQYIRKLIKRMEGDDGVRKASYWCIRRKNDDYLIGTAGLVDLDFGRQSVEWGYGVDPQLWGNGYILQIQEILKKYVFEVLELNRLCGITMIGNERTKSSVIAAGAKPEGISRDYYFKDQKFIDGWRYSILASDLKTSESQTPKIIIDKGDILTAVVNLVGEVFPDEEITPETIIDEILSWDSLGHMNVIISLKENMGVELSPSEIAQATSIKSIVNIVNLKKNT